MVFTDKYKNMIGNSLTNSLVLGVLVVSYLQILCLLAPSVRVLAGLVSTLQEKPFLRANFLHIGPNNLSHKVKYSTKNIKISEIPEKVYKNSRHKKYRHFPEFTRKTQNSRTFSRL